MDFESPSEGEPLDPAWFAPLELVARAIAGDDRSRLFDLDDVDLDELDLHDFMVMYRIRRRGLPELTAYKHIYTRRYLHLDDAGVAYRYISTPGSSTSLGRHVRYRSLRDALIQLRLWELPQLKYGLRATRYGCSPDEPWRVGRDDAVAIDAGTRPRSRGHLRLV